MTIPNPANDERATASHSAALEPGLTRSLRRAGFRLFALALVVRLAFVVISHGIPFTDSRVPDNVSLINETTNIAASLARGQGYSSPFIFMLLGDLNTGPTSWIAPIYPYLCAFFFKIFGVYSNPAFLLIILLQCVFSALTCFPILGIAEQTVGRRAGYLAASLWAIFPWFSQWAVTWIWEISLSALLATTLIWFALRLTRSSSTWSWVGFGAFCGFALLVNPALLTVLVVSVAWTACHRRTSGQFNLRVVTLALLAFAMVLSPWILRNRIAFGQWVFIRSNFGFEFALANFHGSQGRDWAGRHPTSNPHELALYQAMGEPAYVATKFRSAKRFVAQYPMEFACLTIRRVLYFWDGAVMRYAHPTAAFWLPWSYMPWGILLLAAAIFACKRRIPGLWLFLGVILLYPIPYYLTFVQVRYRHVLEPLMLLLISYGVIEALHIWKEKSTQHSSAG